MDYLDDWKQKVVLDGFSSGWEGIDAGVPQGSVLGPFLFLIYINDIVDDLDCNIKLFADDCFRQTCLIFMSFDFPFVRLFGVR